MFGIGDLICIEKNQLKYKKGEQEFKSIPEGVYRVVSGDFDTKRNEGPVFEIDMVGSPDESSITVDWKSLQYNTKWRKL
ncbi:MAG: hypothetical protein K940chlam3_00097 [Chlamydiae bacterium]|nr:hypothetical protein [Chlamydiota bacterium]